MLWDDAYGISEGTAGSRLGSIRVHTLESVKGLRSSLLRVGGFLTSDGLIMSKLMRVDQKDLPRSLVRTGSCILRQCCTRLVACLADGYEACRAALSKSFFSVSKSDLGVSRYPICRKRA